MEFLSLSRRRSFARNDPSSEERGETYVFQATRLVEKIKRYSLKAKSFQNTATYQKLWREVPSIPPVPQGGYERSRVNRALKIRGIGRDLAYVFV